MKDNFILYTQQYSVLESMTDEQLGKLLRALYLYSRDGVEPDFGNDGMLKMAFGFIRMQIDLSNAKYEEKRERLRANAKKRWDDKQKDANASKSIQKDANDTNEYNCMLSIDKNSIVKNRVVKNSKDRMKEEIIEDKSSMSNSVKPNVDPAEKSSESQSSVKQSKAGASEYAAIKEYWNKRHDETNSAMRRMTLMSDNRKTMVRARLRQVGGNIKVLYQVIDNAMSSDFMNGTNGKNWVASFDWIFGSGGNFAKVLDGNYENAMQHDATTAAQSPKPKQSLETGRQTVGERYKKAAQKHDSATDQDNKYRSVIATMLDDLAKNPRNQAAKNSLARFYESGVLQRLGIDWKPEFEK